jgi:ABC-type Fe3+-hydroxamate transport system substrate-binding protein
MKTRLVTDQLNRSVLIPEKPLRIISLVPSQTELLFDLGLDTDIAGITKFCIHPADKVKSKTKIGGTKTLDINKIRQLDPDLIIGNKEENDKEQIELLAKEYPVWMSDIYTLEDASAMILEIGILVNREKAAKELAAVISSGFKPIAPPPFPLRIAYFIWKNPYMTAGGNTFIDHIIKAGGWQNAVSAPRYPEISAEELRKINPDVIFLSSEPYPFKEKHIKEFQELCPGIPVIIVDGELFSWYGSRLKHTPAYLQELRVKIEHLISPSKSF